MPYAYSCQNNPYFFGNFIWKPKPFRHESTHDFNEKYSVTRDLYPLDRYPPFASGMGYAQAWCYMINTNYQSVIVSKRFYIS